MTRTGLVPVTVLGGYLGAGKTTIVNRILAADHGRRLAVLVNDFGAVNVDAGLVAEHDGATLSLENGCICCSIADSLGETLDRVLAIEPAVDQILIEASGVADPAKIAGYGRGWPGCRLDAVAVAVDVETIRARSTDEFVGAHVTRQLTSADLLVLTKLDLVRTDEAADTTAWLARHTDAPTVDGASWAAEPGVLIEPGSRLGRGSAASTARADDRFTTWTIDGGRYRVESELRTGLAALGDDVVRVKGIVRLTDSGGDQRLVQVHKVGRRVEIEPIDAGAPTDLVVIAVRP